MNEIRSEHKVDDVYISATTCVAGRRVSAMSTRSGTWAADSGRWNSFASSTSAPSLRLSHWRLHGNSHPPLETSPRQLVGRSRDQQVTWRQDGVEWRPLSGGHRGWSTGNTTCGVWWDFIRQPVGGAHSRWSRRSSARRQWTRLHQPRTSKLAARWTLLKACPHCRRKVRLSPNSATVAVVSPFSATVALFCYSVDRALQ